MKIVALAGDGIGPEIMAPALKLLKKMAEREQLPLQLQEELVGGAAIDACGDSLPSETLAACKAADAVLLGAVGGPKWEQDTVRPEQGLLRLRKKLGLYANLRPGVIYPSLRGASPLRADLLEDGLDILVVRELTGGIYFGRRGREEREGQTVAFDVEEYAEEEIRRIARVAFSAAQGRKKQVCSIDKANVLESSRLWREVVTAVQKEEFPDVALRHLYVDNAAMQLVRQPAQFDVIVTNNIFGDILSDEVSQITGSIGMLPSASLGEGNPGMFEPIHGSAPDIAGKNSANPFAMVLSVAMMFRYAFAREDLAKEIEQMVDTLLNRGVRTADLATKEESYTGTVEVGEMLIGLLREN